MKKILVCEDEDAIREFEVITLRRAGYEVVDASCGEDAIKYFEAAPNDTSYKAIFRVATNHRPLCRRPDVTTF